VSFILDALKKSESDRQRQSGPALFEVKVAPRRSALPLWGLALGALLAVNLAIVAWMLLRKPAVHADSADLAAPAARVASAPATTPPPAAISPAPTVIAPPPVAVPPAPAPAVNSGTVPAETAASDDETPATEAPPASFAGHVRRGTVDGVPLYQDVAPGSRIPELRLDLHVYAGAPQERFVMINMHKLREGESLPEGVRLESITPEGAVLAYNGVRFLLPRE
jgi:general secretion pathway protein B